MCTHVVNAKWVMAYAIWNLVFCIYNLSTHFSKLHHEIESVCRIISKIDLPASRGEAKRKENRGNLGCQIYKTNLASEDPGRLNVFTDRMVVGERDSSCFRLHLQLDHKWKGVQVASLVVRK